MNCLYVKKKIFSKNLKLSWFANSLVVGPQLNNIFGYYGINSNLLCKDFNKKTEKLPSYFLVSVFITIKDNRNFFFSFSLPSITFFFNSASFLKEFEILNQGRFILKMFKVIKIIDFLYICKLKGFDILSYNSLKSIFFIVKSMGIYIIYD